MSIKKIRSMSKLIKIRRVYASFNVSNYEKFTPSQYSMAMLTHENVLQKENKNLLEFLCVYFGYSKVWDRLKRKDCIAFVASNRDGKPVGYYWSVVPKNKEVWHDKFKIVPQEALLFNAFVIPEFRKKGVYKSLQFYAHSHILKRENCKTVYTIVEESNLASMNANRKFGLQMVKTNVLLKLFGCPMFSIYWGNNKVSIHWVFKNEQGNSL